MIFDSLPFVETLSRLVSTCFQRYIEKGVPDRPVVSACGSATEGMSEIVDFFLQPYMPTIPGSIEDADDFIRRIRNLY